MTTEPPRAELPVAIIEIGLAFFFGASEIISSRSIFWHYGIPLICSIVLVYALSRWSGWIEVVKRVPRIPPLIFTTLVFALTLVLWVPHEVPHLLRTNTTSSSKKNSRNISPPAPSPTTSDSSSPSSSASASPTITIPPAAPKLALDFPHTVSAGHAVPFTWSSKPFTDSVNYELQRREGTSGTWTDVSRLGSPGSAHAPGIPMGSTEVRIVARVGEASPLSQSVVRVHSYAQVPLSALIPGTSGVVSTTTHAFSYVLQVSNSTSGPSLTASGGSCNYIHLDWVPADNMGYPEPGEVVTMRLQRERGDPVEVSAADRHESTLTATLSPGESWALFYSLSGGQLQLDWYLNGYANCYSDARFDVNLGS